MTSRATNVDAPPPAAPAVTTWRHWHRPLLVTAAIMALCALVSVVGVLVDQRDITGQPAWEKPLKFSLSILLYSVTWSCLIGQLPRWRRAATTAGTVTAIALVVEQIAIVAAAAAGTTSHFNVSSPLSTAVWAVMATAITVLYLATFITTVALAFLSFPDRSLTLAVRLGAAIALLGLGLAYLMTGPTAAQLADFHGIVGAHTVGIADGGPGLPVLGWSTVGGDLRIPHFIGMHALQLIPLGALALRGAGRRLPLFADVRLRARLVIAGSGAYLLGIALVTLQALSGESIAHPSPLVVAIAWSIVSAAAAASIVAVLVARRQTATSLP